LGHGRTGACLPCCPVLRGAEGAARPPVRSRGRCGTGRVWRPPGGRTVGDGPVRATCPLRAPTGCSAPAEAGAVEGGRKWLMGTFEMFHGNRDELDDIGSNLWAATQPGIAGTKRRS